jgi:hypothetical protein
MEAGPWPTVLGNPQRTQASSATATATGKVLWSTDLELGASGIATRDDGQLFIATRGSVLMFGPEGDKRGSVPCNPTGEISLLSDGRMVVAERDGVTSYLTVRQQTNGRRLATIPDWDHAPAITADGLVLFAFRQVGKPSELRAFDLDGRFHWSAPMSWPDIFPPLLVGEWIVVLEDRQLKAFNYQGRPAWTASRQGFDVVPAEKPPTEQALGEQLGIENAAIIDHERILVSFGADGFFLFHVSNKTVEPIGARLSWGYQAAFPVVEGKTQLITSLGTAFGFGRTPKGWLVGKHSIVGDLAWEHDTGIEPDFIVADKAGKAIIATSTSWREWEKRKWSPAARPEMLDHCYVRCLATDGEELFTWWPETPFNSPLAIGAAGEIYVVAGGKLWALA